MKNVKGKIRGYKDKFWKRSGVFNAEGRRPGEINGFLLCCCMFFEGQKNEKHYCVIISDKNRTLAGFYKDLASFGSEIRHQLLYITFILF